MKTVAVIPALNEVVGLAKVLNEIPAGWIDDAIVVDGASTDGTPEFAARTMARARDLGLSVDLVAPILDVDTADDLARLRRELQRLPDHVAPNTRRVLETINGR